jgi:hypothetical protein
MMRIYYWPDGCWVFDHELHSMHYKSDDYGVLELPEDVDEHTIDCIVFDEVSK